MQTLSALKVAREEITFHGGANNVKIPPTLLSKHTHAYHNYRKRIEEEATQKKDYELQMKAKEEAARKRRAEQSANEEFEEKRKKLEAEEKSLAKEIQFDKTLRMTMTSRVDKSSDVEEVRSAFKASQQLQEGIDKVDY